MTCEEYERQWSSVQDHWVVNFTAPVWAWWWPNPRLVGPYGSPPGTYILGAYCVPPHVGEVLVFTGLATLKEIRKR